MPRNWTENELLIAMNLYCKLPFGQFDKANRSVRDVAEKMGRTPSSVSMKLCNLASLDSYHQDRGVAGLKGASRLDKAVWQKFQDNWTVMAEKSEAAIDVLMSGKDVVKHDVEVVIPDGPSEVERTVKARRLQTFFRNAVLSSYEYKCAVSLIAIPALLNASHIIPWSEEVSRRADPANGICLNVLYDRAFDRGLITFDEDYRLVVSTVLKKGALPECQKSNFVKMEGSKLHLPHRFCPDSIALERHRNNIFQA